MPLSLPLKILSVTSATAALRFLDDGGLGAAGALEDAEVADRAGLARDMSNSSSGTFAALVWGRAGSAAREAAISGFTGRGMAAPVPVG